MDLHLELRTRIMPGPNDTFTLHAPLYGLPRPQDLCLARDASMQGTRDAIDARTDVLWLEALALGALRNATLPINQLPNELFVEILLMTCSNPNPQGLQYPEHGEP
ncbi:hypothetical protein C8Q74DRAFT_313900 [Fomes fomentarius]|nr:hypothetical protein C8Q74DRAFT_313900 [Fomes fomentarius]